MLMFRTKELLQRSSVLLAVARVVRCVQISRSRLACLNQLVSTDVEIKGVLL